MNDFTTLGLSAPILAALEQSGYTTPTPIQTQAIPVLIKGRDLVGIAQTGTGKTAAFALPILHQLTNNPKAAPARGCRALVLSPTRELATQIGDNFLSYSTNLDISTATVFGGVSHRPQIQALRRGVDVLIATPGRLLDHIASGEADIGSTEILVLDEADQMLDLGFLKPIRQIIGKLPTERQTLLFSATMPQQIARLAKDFLRNPERVTVAPVSSTAERVSQRIIHIEASQKRHLLAKLFAEQQMARTLVFTRTKHGANRLAKHLQARGITVAAIHGNKSQPQRERALEAFRESKIQVLVATDIAARGIDIEDVTHVVNYELPEVPEAYVHRIGRTARAGASGTAISFCDDSELKYLRGIERLTRQKISSETYSNGETVPDAPASSYNPIASTEAEREKRLKQSRSRSGNGHRPKGKSAASTKSVQTKSGSNRNLYGSTSSQEVRTEKPTSTKQQRSTKRSRNSSNRNAKPTGSNKSTARRGGRGRNFRKQSKPTATAV